MIERLPGQNITLENKVESNEAVNKEKRYMQILDALGDRDMTAREIANEMYMREMIPNNERNFTAPRLTELSIKGIVEPVGKKKCMWTNKTVSVYKRRVN